MYLFHHCDPSCTSSSLHVPSVPDIVEARTPTKEQRLREVAKSKDQWTKAVNSWYDEIQYYNFTTGRSKGGVTGHFTQVVWTASTQVGCGFNDKCTNMFGGGRR